jgi:hypothetical protein
LMCAWAFMCLCSHLRVLCMCLCDSVYVPVCGHAYMILNTYERRQLGKTKVSIRLHSDECRRVILFLIYFFKKTSSVTLPSSLLFEKETVLLQHILRRNRKTGVYINDAEIDSSTKCALSYKLY